MKPFFESVQLGTSFKMFPKSTICFIILSVISAWFLGLIFVQKKNSESDTSKPEGNEQPPSDLEDFAPIEYDKEIVRKVISITVEDIANELIAFNEEFSSPMQRSEVAELIKRRVKNWYLSVGTDLETTGFKEIAKRYRMSLLKFCTNVAYFMTIGSKMPETMYEDSNEMMMMIIVPKMFGFKEGDENAIHFIRDFFEASEVRRRKHESNGITF